MQSNKKNSGRAYGILIEGYVGKVKIQFIAIVCIGVLGVRIGYISPGRRCRLVWFKM